jgi:hypothetical protein
MILIIQVTLPDRRRSSPIRKRDDQGQCQTPPVSIYLSIYLSTYIYTDKSVDISSFYTFIYPIFCPFPFIICCFIEYMYIFNLLIIQAKIVLVQIKCSVCQDVIMEKGNSNKPRIRKVTANHIRGFTKLPLVSNKMYDSTLLLPHMLDPPSFYILIDPCCTLQYHQASRGDMQ